VERKNHKQLLFPMRRGDLLKLYIIKQTIPP
jgi:hypothetical protein